MTVVQEIGQTVAADRKWSLQYQRRAENGKSGRLREERAVSKRFGVRVARERCSKALHKPYLNHLPFATHQLSHPPPNQPLESPEEASQRDVFQHILKWSAPSARLGAFCLSSTPRRRFIARRQIVIIVSR